MRPGLEVSTEFCGFAGLRVELRGGASQDDLCVTSRRGWGLGIRDPKPKALDPKNPEISGNKLDSVFFFTWSCNELQISSHTRALR